ncbi:MAG TPA: hypothetical protein QF624_08770 [Dehalococcoidia bacterium]|nr:hypothetical protein [Dehalococcoidia bacterium]
MPARKIPRPFSMHWGDGQIIEEAGFDGDHTAPAIQLMRFDDGEAAGSRSIRFCHFSHRGQFQRSPMIISEDEIDALREAVAQTPELQRLLLRIAGG